MENKVCQGCQHSLNSELNYSLYIILIMIHVKHGTCMGYSVSHSKGEADSKRKRRKC